MKANQMSISGPKALPTAAVPNLCMRNSANSTAAAIGMV